MQSMSSTRRHFAISLQQASEASPTLSRLMAQTQESARRLQAVQQFIPPGLRPHVQAGPIEGDTWCLLVKNSAAAARLRYLLPGMEAHLRTKGWDVAHIRVKVLANGG